MNITLELLHGVAIVKNHGAIPITSDPLVISILSRNYVRDNLFVTACINDVGVTFEIVDGIAVAPEIIKQSGELTLTVRKIINGEVLQIWESEKIMLKELEGGYEAIPQITALMEKVNALTEAVAELKNIVVDNGGF